MKTMTNLEKFGLAAALIIACTFFYMKYMYDPQTKVLTTTLKKRNKVVAELNKLRDIPPLFQLEKSIEHKYRAPRRDRRVVKQDFHHHGHE
jgi:hypothetical protein